MCINGSNKMICENCGKPTPNDLLANNHPPPQERWTWTAINIVTETMRDLYDPALDDDQRRQVFAEHVERLCSIREAT